MESAEQCLSDISRPDDHRPYCCAGVVCYDDYQTWKEGGDSLIEGGGNLTSKKKSQAGYVVDPRQVTGTQRRHRRMEDHAGNFQQPALRAVTGRQEMVGAIGSVTKSVWRAYPKRWVALAKVGTYRRPISARRAGRKTS